MDVDQALALVNFVTSNYFHFDPFLELWEPSNVIVGRILLSITFEISMINSVSLVDLMVARLLPISWVRLFSIAHGLNVPFFSGSVLHVKCVGYDCRLDLGDSSSPARI